MSEVQVALDAQTIDSQVAELRQRVTQDGFDLVPEQEFVDDGYSGATLIRPALERLRDVVAAGGIDRLSVVSDREVSQSREQPEQRIALSRAVPGEVDIGKRAQREVHRLSQHEDARHDLLS